MSRPTKPKHFDDANLLSSKEMIRFELCITHKSLAFVHRKISIEIEKKSVMNKTIKSIFNQYHDDISPVRTLCLDLIDEYRKMLQENIKLLIEKFILQDKVKYLNKLISVPELTDDETMEKINKVGKKMRELDKENKTILQNELNLIRLKLDIANYEECFPYYIKTNIILQKLIVEEKENENIQNKYKVENDEKINEIDKIEDIENVEDKDN
jgi:hypothetical protein